MKKNILLWVLLMTITFTSPAFAEQSDIEYSPGFAIFDLVLYRPIGLAATIVGAGVFVGLSPLTALAQISPPHDAFDKTTDIFVVAPFKYTFARPLGEWWPLDEWSFHN